MKTVDVHSDEFQRGMALHYLKEHKRHTSFRAGLSQPTIDELKLRGCDVVLEPAHGIYTVSSPIPFGHLVTPAEWRQDRLELFQGVGLLILTKGGYIAVIALTVSLNLGLLTGAIWVWGWRFLISAAFPDCERLDKIKAVIIGLLLFGAGIAVKLLGWSATD